MKFKFYNEYGALNSKPVFAALEHGIKHSGGTVVNSGQDIDVIWSVLWHGRMQRNQQVYNQALATGRPVMIIEVGNLNRGETWRLSLNHINALGEFGNHLDLDPLRPAKLGIKLQPLQQTRQSAILIACQHDRSLQWQGQPSMQEWVKQTVKEIQKYSSRPIVVRPHPRCPFTLSIPGVKVDIPRALPNTYDGFNFNFDYHCVINHNSGPAIAAAINGTPIITDSTSLAYPVSDTIKNIETVSLKDREDWIIQLSHTEWTVPEIMTGIPIKRLLTNIK